MRRACAARLTVAVLVAGACGTHDDGVMMTVDRTRGASDAVSTETVSSEAWTRLAGRRILFGHQSVGYNIMDGVADVLRSRPGVALAVVESSSDGDLSAPGFYHQKVGRNLFPAEKLAEFATIAEREFATGTGIGMVKLCYVDVQGDTDPQALFSEYRRRMSELAALRPGLTLVHVTMPLTTAPRSLGYWRDRLLGHATAEDLNVIRSRYNALLLEAYAGREPVFDLARIESTRPDGSRSSFVRGTDTIPTLATEYTADGGHLTVAARRIVAERLLEFLARLPAP